MVVEMLAVLRAERFSLRAWGKFLRCSWLMSDNAPRQSNVDEIMVSPNDALCMLALFILATTSISEGINTMLRMLPSLAICIAWQQSDSSGIWLNRPSSDTRVATGVGAATR